MGCFILNLIGNSIEQLRDELFLLFTVLLLNAHIEYILEEDEQIGFVLVFNFLGLQGFEIDVDELLEVVDS